MASRRARPFFRAPSRGPSSLVRGIPSTSTTVRSGLLRATSWVSRRRLELARLSWVDALRELHVGGQDRSRWWWRSAAGRGGSFSGDRAGADRGALPLGTSRRLWVLDGAGNR